MAKPTPTTATQRAVLAFQSGDTKGALRITKEFRLGVTPAERAQLARAYECLVRPDFYRQLGYSLEWEVEQGVVVFTRLFLRRRCSYVTNNSTHGKPS